MQLSERFVDALISRLVDEGVVTDYASEYGEPGYSFSGDGTTERFLLGNWWCKCGEFHRYPDGRLQRHRFYRDDEHGPPSPKTLHGVEQHHPRLWAQLESQGVETAFDDGWMVDYETGKAYRTEPDSYSWQRSVVMDDVGEWMTPDTDIEVWVGWATREPDRRCLFESKRSELEDAGFENVNGVFANGWYPGQSDEPPEILARYKAMDPDKNAEYVFCIDGVGQFDIHFVLYRRGEPINEEGDDAEDDRGHMAGTGRSTRDV
jgi:hypothetical protein